MISVEFQWRHCGNYWYRGDWYLGFSVTNNWYYTDFRISLILFEIVFCWRAKV